MKVAKSIDELYEEVKNYDLVITNDAPLATALNAKVDVARVGPFAQTPQMIAMLLSSEILNSRTRDNIETINLISEETGLDFNFVHSEIENIREIRRHTCSVEKYLYSEVSRRVYRSYKAIPTMEKAMDVFDPEKSNYFRSKKSIAVIGVEFFNDLDKHFIPLDCDFIDIIKDDDGFEIDMIYEIGNDRQIADNAVDLIPGDKATDYAIVVDTASPIADAVRSALYRKKISFINHVSVRDLDFIRDYLNFLTLSLDYESLRVKDVKEIFSNYNGYFRKGRDNYLLNRQNENDMTANGLELKNKMANIRSLTFGEIATICNKMAKIQVDIVLKELNLYDEKVTSKLVGRLVYAVDNIAELKHSTEIGEDEKTGVLIADANNSVYIDRPIVMYLGMDEGWEPKVAGKKYLDVEEEMETDALRLQILLQQGEHRFYFVNCVKNGDVAQPCSTFDLIFNEDCSPEEHKEIRGFSDICNNLISGRWYEEPEERIHEKGENLIENTDPIGSFSKSSFNSFMKCPRAYMYNSLIDFDDKKSTEFGNLIHDFAEFYTCYPEFVREKGIDDMIELVTERYEGLSSPLLSDIDRGRIVKALSHIMRYIDDLGFKAPIDRDESDKYPNVFLSTFDICKKTTVCETDSRSNKHPIYGKFDLVAEGTIHDYKTGKKSDVKSIIENMSVAKIAKYAEYQPLMYLSIGIEKGYRKFRLFYAMDNDTTPDDIYNPAASTCTVNVCDGGIKGLLSNKDIREFIRTRERVYRKEYREKIDDIFDMILDLGDFNTAGWCENGELVSLLNKTVKVKPSKDSKDPELKFLNSMHELFKDGIIGIKDSIIVTTDALNNFLTCVDSSYEMVKKMFSTEFPADPKIDCENCEYKSLCTKDIVKIEEADMEGDE